jgi:radical SAM superfamily enzyme YgiQ (UPF0313 family)
MKILLIRPKPHRNTIGLQNVMICEPLELEYLAGNIDNLGHESIIVDMILEKKKIDYFINKYQPEVVGITGYISHVNVIKNYARRIKEIDGNIKTIVGGVHAEVSPEDFWDDNIDYIVRANGIKTFIKLINNLQMKKNEMIPSVYTRTGNNKCLKENTFNYMFPKRTKVAQYRKKYYYMFHRNCALIKTSFGCPYSCNFCFCRAITDGQYFARNNDDIIEELKTIKETEIYIVDDDFLIDKPKIMDFCLKLERENIQKRYLIYARADFIADNEDVIEQFKKNGLRAVIVGLESCDGDQLTGYNKKTSVNINEQAVFILKKYDIECYGTFILGTDWDKDDFERLGKWIKRLGLIFVNLQPFTPLKGTEIYNRNWEFIIGEDEYEKWDLAHLVIKPGKLSVRKYYWYTVLLYYKITVNLKSSIYMIKKYGLRDTFKLSIGAFKVNLQYIKKIVIG